MKDYSASPKLCNTFLILFSIFFISFFIFISICEFTEKRTAKTEIIKTGIVEKSSCIERFYNVTPTNYKVYYNVCRLKVKWNNGKLETANFKFPVIEGDCIALYKTIHKKYNYFSGDTPDYTWVTQKYDYCD